MKRPRRYGVREDAVLRTHIELSRALLKLRAKETAWLDTRGLTLPQFAILESLYHLGSMRVGEVTKLILSTPGNITVVLKNLEQKGLIESTPDPKDRRVKRLSITGAGRTLIGSIFPEHVANLRQWYETALDPEEIETLGALLRKLEKHQS